MILYSIRGSSSYWRITWRYDQYEGHRIFQSGLEDQWKRKSHIWEI